MTKKCIKVIFSLQEPKKPPKTIFSVFRTILDENLIWKKKFKKFTQKCPKSRIFEISKFDLFPEMAENRPISTTNVPACPNSHQNFLYCPTPKIHEKIEKMLPPKSRLFFGGGGEIIKCQKRQKCLNMFPGLAHK